jgi:hypothetical protein
MPESTCTTPTAFIVKFLKDFVLNKKVKKFNFGEEIVLILDFEMK